MDDNTGCKVPLNSSNRNGETIWTSERVLGISERLRANEAPTELESTCFWFGVCGIAAARSVLPLVAFELCLISKFIVFTLGCSQSMLTLTLFTLSKLRTSLHRTVHYGAGGHFFRFGLLLLHSLSR